MKKNYCWRKSAVFTKLTSAFSTLVLLFAFIGSTEAQTDCSIDNLQGGVASGTLSIMATPGNGLAFLVDPEGTGEVGNPGCGVIAPYTYTINSVDLNMADASLFGVAGDGLGTYEYTVSIVDMAMDTCTVLGTTLWTSETLTEAMGDEGFHPVNVPVGLEVTQPFFVLISTVSWDGLATASPSVFLWDANERPQCRQFVLTDGGSTVTDHGNYFVPPANGWYNGVVNGSFTDSNPCLGAIFCDDFDSYNADEYVGSQSDVWTTWTDAPGTAEDAFVSTEHFSSAPNSLLLEQATTDLILPLGDLTSGSYEISMKMYLPDTMGGYYNLMHHFDNVNNVYEWGLEVFFDGSGAGHVTAAGTDSDFSYSQDAWIEVVNLIDLDSDLAELWIEGVMVRSWQWSINAGDGNPGENKLAVADFFPDAVDNPKYFIDNVLMKESDPLGCGFPAIVCDKIDTYNANEYLAAQSAGLWTTWSDAPGTAEDAYVVDSMFFSAPNSALLKESTTDLVLPLGNLTSGAYEVGMKMYFPAGFGGYFNLMHVFDPAGTYEWAIDVFFNGDGTGYSTAEATDEDFTYPEDMWIDVYCNIDLDNDLAALWVDGVNVRTWQWSINNGTGAAGTNQLAVADFFPDAVDNPTYYIDNVYMKEGMPMDCDFEYLICDNYDLYDEGALGPQAAHWSTWSGAEGGAEDGIVSTDQALSTPNSMFIDSTGSQDVLLLLGNQDAGKHTLEMDIYIPAGQGGYFNVQEDEEAGVAWNLEVWFNRDNAAPATGSFADTNPQETFIYPESEWFHVRMDFDLDADYMNFFADDEKVFEGFIYAGHIGSVDFFSGDDNNKMYVDNVLFYPNIEVSTKDISVSSDFSIYPNPNNGTFNISSPDLSGTYILEMIDVTGRMVHSEQVNLVNNAQAEISTSGLNSGIYVLRLINRSTDEIHTSRVSIQY